MAINHLINGRNIKFTYLKYVKFKVKLLLNIKDSLFLKRTKKEKNII